METIYPKSFVVLSDWTVEITFRRPLGGAVLRQTFS
jgi:hypothetical protein